MNPLDAMPSPHIERLLARVSDATIARFLAQSAVHFGLSPDGNSAAEPRHSQTQFHNQNPAKEKP